MFKKIIQSKIFTIFAVLLAIFLGLKLLVIQTPLSDLSKEASNIKQKITEAEEKNAALSQQAQYLTSQGYLERQARLKLNYKNPDEEAVQIYRVAVASKSSEDTSASIFSKISDWFKNLTN